MESTDSIADVIKVIIEHGFSRIPIYEDNVDNIVGVVYAKDLLRHGVVGDDQRPLKAVAREPYYTPEAKRVGELLREMRERKVHIAVVVDEHGGTAGIVTFEDLIEEIVGPIRDEYDTGEVEELQIVSDNEVVVSARFPVDDLKEELDLPVPNVDADTVGGLVYELLGEIPKVGATIKLGDATLTVESIRRQGIQSVRIVSPVSLVRDRGVRAGDHDGQQEARDTQEESPAHARRQ